MSNPVAFFWHMGEKGSLHRCNSASLFDAERQRMRKKPQDRRIEVVGSNNLAHIRNTSASIGNPV